MPRRDGGTRFATRKNARARAASGRSGEDGREPIEARRGSKLAAPAAAALAPGLYVVATPIGNLGDITLRALDTLKRADLVVCEDTRVTATLAQCYGIPAERWAYHDHNAEAMRPRILERLRTGAAVALVSDAGTPLISDPGFKLVRAALAEGIAVTALPGASALLAALVVAGLPTDRFFFGGFLPAKEAARRRVLAELKTVPATLVFFEAASRLAASLADMTAVLGERQAAVARELTKLHEEVRRGALLELARHYENAGAPKGEIAIVVAPPADAPEMTEGELDAEIKAALQTMSVSAASAAVAAATGLPRRQVYARALQLAGKRQS